MSFYGDDSEFAADQSFRRPQRQQVTYDGRRMRKPVVRKTVDFNASIIVRMHHRIYNKTGQMDGILPTADYLKDLATVLQVDENPSMAYCTKYVATAVNKVRCPINCAVFTPESRRLLTGAHTGELTLWNGLTFNFETIIQAHDCPIRAMQWSHSDTWLITADEQGIVKYWQASMNNVKAFKAHKDPIRDLSFSPTDAKFATASDDQTISIWDFETATEDSCLRGHGWDIKAVQWHPFQALVASGSKDNLVKLWDPKMKVCLSTLHGHKSQVNRLAWNSNGVSLLSGGRDNLVKLWDMRMMKEVESWRGHKKEITALAWHPFVETLFVSASYDGSIHHWLVNESESQAEIAGAHDGSVNSLTWHQLGHMLVSSSSDHSVRFWTRNRPGDDMKDKYNVNQLPEAEKVEALQALVEAARLNPQRGSQRNAASTLQTLEEQLQSSTMHLTKVDSTGEAFIPGLGTSQHDLQRIKEEQERERMKHETGEQQTRKRGREDEYEYDRYRDDRDRERERDRDRGRDRERERDRDRDRDWEHDRERDRDRYRDRRDAPPPVHASRDTRIHPDRMPPSMQPAPMSQSGLPPLPVPHGAIGTAHALPPLPPPQHYPNAPFPPQQHPSQPPPSSSSHGDSRSDSRAESRARDLDEMLHRYQLDDKARTAFNSLTHEQRIDIAHRTMDWMRRDPFDRQKRPANINVRLTSLIRQRVHNA